VRARLRRLHPALEAELALALELLGLGDAREPAPTLDDATRRARLSVFLRRLVQARSALEPSVLLVDDSHWIDPESDALLGEIVDALGWTRTLLLLNFRPEYSARWMSVSYYQAVHLAPLAPDAAAELTLGLVGSDAALRGLSQAVAERAEGNPFFIEEIVRDLADQGVFVRGPKGVRLAGAADQLRIPGTVQAVLAARIDRLPEPAKHALQTAAVVGKRFSESVLRQVIDTEIDLAGALATLQRAGMIEREPSEGAPRLAFKHSLTHEVAYFSQLQETRAQTHERVARALEVAKPARLGEQAAEIAHHWHAAGKRYEARLWSRRAALRVTNIQVGRGSRREVRPTRPPGD
jgi:adenylate cyclase